MIVWGGFSATGYLNSGGSYDPVSDDWLQTSTGTNVPLARALHTAIWTGSRMIVWGGQGASGASVNTGGRYDPAADTWTPTSTGSGVPTERKAHAAVWTDALMVVWSGTLTTGFEPSGSRYDPNADAWTPTSIGTGTPIGRALPSAFWTGAQMIVWGGQPTTGSGGLYCACLNPAHSFRDADGDGYGDPATPSSTCDGSIPVGYVTAGGDCDDTNPAIHPGATEVCNGVDDNCDGIVNNGGSALCDDGNVCTDDACNGIAGCGHTNNTSPCDDGNACTTDDVCSEASCAGTPGPVPVEVTSVFASKDGTTAVLSWDATAGAATYDLLRGSVLGWPVGSTPAMETCLAGNVVSTRASDDTVPAIGDGYWYLVRADNACGSGSYGSQESQGVPAAPRASATCP
jgi:hypothetical protein